MPKYALIDDTNPGLVYTGNWTAMTTPLNVNGPEFNNTYHMTNDPNATVSFNFFGSYILAAWIKTELDTNLIPGTIVNVFGTIDAPAVHGVPHPIFRIDPNNFPPSVFNSSGNVAVIPDANANVATAQIRMFQSGKFAEGNYTMVVQAGDPSSSATSGDAATFYFDFLTIQVGDSVYSEYVILDDGSDQFHYTEGWTTGSMTGNYLNTVHRTPDQGGQMTVGFHGTEISLYGTIDGPYAEDAPLGLFQIDGGQTHTVLAGNVTQSALLANGTEMRNQLIWRTTGLRDIGQGQHTLTMSSPPARNTSSSTSSTSTSASESTTATPTNPPWFLDYVVYGPSSAITSRSTSTPSPSASVSPSSAPPAGAIVGGVIGGLAGIALILLGFLFWRRGERNKAAAKEVQGGFETNYASSTAASRPTLSGRRSSIHKGRSGGMRGGRGGGEGGMEGGPVLDISSTSPLASMSGHVGTSTMTGPGTADSAYETEYAVASLQQRPVPRHVREMDGGVRLASGSDFDSEVVDVLPPSYARYGEA